MKTSSDMFIQLKGNLFEKVQMDKIFPDSKTFVDSYPLSEPDKILEKYEAQKHNPSFNLKKFICENFSLPESQCLDDKLAKNRTMDEHIEMMWKLLLRKPDAAPSPYSTLLPLPRPYIIPGGRFLEVYYWDSYFTCEGLVKAGRLDIVENIADNFAYLLEKYGHIPNGNRVYYLSRSQPPFFCSILNLLYSHKGLGCIKKHLASLEKEYDFWMNTGRVVRYGGNLMNRYWDDSPVPREESYWQDVELCSLASPPDSTAFYRNIRAAAESGWDFSSRWFKDGKRMSTIITTEILPVDLNCLLYDLEVKLSRWLAESGDKTKAASYMDKSLKRKNAINSTFWDEAEGFYFDFNHVAEKRTAAWSLAALYPLYFKLADKSQAEKVAANIAARFLKPGGAVTTLEITGQQWDYPNGWAPLQWITCRGLENYGFSELAGKIADNFVKSAEDVFNRTGKMMEKYNVCDLSLLSGGGEYPNQDGFGWTNGVVCALRK